MNGIKRALSKLSRMSQVLEERRAKMERAMRAREEVAVPFPTDVVRAERVMGTLVGVVILAYIKMLQSYSRGNFSIIFSRESGVRLPGNHGGKITWIPIGVTTY